MRNLPHTSLEAHQNSAAFSGAHDAIICGILADYPNGLTAEGIAEMSRGQINSVQVNRKMKELEDAGRAVRIQIGIKDNGKPLYECRKNRNGLRMAVWFFVPLEKSYG